MQADSTISAVKLLKRIGFKALIGWHYLVLFSPLLMSSGESAHGAIFERQLVLYFSIALTFALLALMKKRAYIRQENLASLPLIVCAAVVASFATVLSGLPFTYDLGDAARVATAACLGVSEAFIMFVWLNYLTKLTFPRPLRVLGSDAAIGGALALFVGSLVSPIDLVVSAALPLVSIVSLVLYRDKFSRPLKDAPDEPWRLRDKTSLSFAAKRLVPTMVYALVFGLVQGAFFVNGIELLIARNSLVYLGAAIVGIIVFLVPTQPGSRIDIDTIHRFSLLFFVCGIVGLSFVGVLGSSGHIGLADGGVILVLSEIAIMAGFNMFDFGGLILGIDLAGRHNAGSWLLVDSGRVLVYACLAVGLFSGAAIMDFSGSGNAELALLTICGLAILCLVVTVIIPSFNQEGYSDFVSQAESALKDVGRVDERLFDERAAAKCDGQEDETETPKTPRVSERVETPVRIEVLERVEAPSVTRESGSKPVSSKLTEGAGGSQGEAKSPWRDACQEIIELYRLSPREAEVFMLIAKGRNAEYVQKELVISFYTAKTHIANIYHKLDVHSSQQMLNLIEAFERDDD